MTVTDIDNQNFIGSWQWQDNYKVENFAVTVTIDCQKLIWAHASKFSGAIKSLKKKRGKIKHSPVTLF